MQGEIEDFKFLFALSKLCFHGKYRYEYYLRSCIFLKNCEKMYKTGHFRNLSVKYSVIYFDTKFCLVGFVFTCLEFYFANVQSCIAKSQKAKIRYFCCKQLIFLKKNAWMAPNSYLCNQLY